MAEGTRSRGCLKGAAMGCGVVFLVVACMALGIASFHARQERRRVEELERFRAEYAPHVERIAALEKARRQAEAESQAKEDEESVAASPIEAVDAGEVLRRVQALEQEVRFLRGRIAELEGALEARGADPTPTGEASGMARVPVEQPTRNKTAQVGPTAVTDPGQIRKVLDGLNALLARAGGTETYRVTVAEALDGDRLVRATLEATAREGGLSRSFRAEEARFVLRSVSRTLEIRLNGVTVTYPGERTVGFPEGRYTATLEVDPEPFRTSGNPLIEVW